MSRKEGARKASLTGELITGSPLASSAGGARCLRRPAILQRDPLGPPPSTQRVSPRRLPPVRSCRQAEVPLPPTVPAGQGQRGSRIPSPCRRRFLRHYGVCFEATRSSGRGSRSPAPIVSSGGDGLKTGFPSGIGKSALRCSHTIGSLHPLGSFFIVRRARAHFYFMAKLDQLRANGLTQHACPQNSYSHSLLLSASVGRRLTLRFSRVSFASVGSNRFLGKHVNH
jgi:hypothetical protein